MTRVRFECATRNDSSQVRVCESQWLESFYSSWLNRLQWFISKQLDSGQKRARLVIWFVAYTSAQLFPVTLLRETGVVTACFDVFPFFTSFYCFHNLSNSEDSKLCDNKKRRSRNNVAPSLNRRGLSSSHSSTRLVSSSNCKLLFPQVPGLDLGIHYWHLCLLAIYSA